MTVEELYQKFSPKLIDAVARSQLKENNFIRQHLGLPKITLQQAVNSITQEYEDIPDYPWMNENLV
jgi:hypothetical protein